MSGTNAGRTRIPPGGIGSISIKQQSDTGRWVAYGRARQLNGGYVAREVTRLTRAAARDDVRAALNSALKTSSGPRTLLKGSSAFSSLVEAWIEEEARSSQNTAETQAAQHRSARRNLVSVLGGLSIEEITAPVCDQAYNDLLAPRRKLPGRAVELPADAARRRDKEGGNACEGDPGIVREVSARNDMAVLHKVMAKAVRMGLRPDNPATTVQLRRKGKKEIKFLEADDYRVLRNAVERYRTRGSRMGPKPNRDLGDVLDVAVGTGARIGEVLGIRLEDIDLTNRPTLTVHIRGTVIEGDGIGKQYQPWTKKKKPHRVRAPEWLDAVIRDRRADPTRAGDTFLFESAAGKPLGARQLRLSWRKVRTWAGMPEWLIPHVLRKSAVTQTRQVMGIEAASRLANHSNLRITQAVYDGTALVPYEITKAMETFGPAQTRPDPFEMIVGALADETAQAQLRATTTRILESIRMLNPQTPDAAREAVIDSVLARLAIPADPLL